MDSASLHLIGQDSDDGAGAGNTQPPSVAATSRPGIVRRHQQFRQRGKDPGVALAEASLYISSILVQHGVLIQFKFLYT
jgi:hypothetical protein